FGEQSTLTAVAHGDTPLPLKQLKKNNWEVVQQALTYQRSARPENPEKLVAMLKKSNKTRIAFPLAVLAAAGVTVFAGQHLVSRLSEFLQPSINTATNSTATQQANTGSSLLATQSEQTTMPSTQPQADNESDPQQAVITSEAKSNDVAKQAAIAEIKLVGEGTDAVGETDATPATESQTAVTENTNVQPETIDSDNQQAADESVATTESADAVPENTDNSLASSTDTATTGEVITENTAESTTTGAVLRSATATTEEQESTTTQDTTANKKQEIDQLLKQAVAAFNAGKLEDADDSSGAITLLRDVLKIDDENSEAATLIGKVIEKKYHAAERQMKKKEFNAAEATLQESDKLIREFMLTEKLQRQVKMESKMTILAEEQTQINELLQNAKTAISRNKLSKEDGKNNALSYLSRV
ncbi:MAG: hypothetical protein ACPGVP_05900, partial [Thiolinea sp.]